MTNGIKEMNKKSAVADGRSLSETDLETLRFLLLGPEYQSVLDKNKILENPVLLGKLIAPAINEALKITPHDSDLEESLAPTVLRSLLYSISTDPKPVADALYPVMGPAIRISISATMNQMTSNFNELLEQSISPRAWRWRFDAWRTGRSYSEVVLIKNLVFQVEQVFLIHRKTGLLVQHIQSDTSVSKDPDMVSGMLTAIQDFISDSFSVEQNSGLNSLKLGDLTVLIENGPYAALAAVVRGTLPKDMQEILTETVEIIHLREHKRLIDYKGNPNDFNHLKPLLSSCLKTELISKQNEDKKELENKKKRPFKYGTYLLLAISWFIYSNYQSGLEQDEWINIQHAYRSEPGLVVTSATFEQGKYQIAGLADPLAIEPSLLISRGTLDNIEVELIFKPYLSLDPSIVLKRIQENFNIPDSVKLSLNSDVLSLSGRSTRSWLDKFETDMSKVSGIRPLDTNKLSIVR